MKVAARTYLALLGMGIVVMAWSAWWPDDRFTWWLAVTPGRAGFALLFTFGLAGAAALLLCLCTVHNDAIEKGKAAAR